MAKRGRKVDPDSDNQLIKEIFFGKADKDSYSNVWRDWPEPYKTIYSRMFNHGFTFYPGKVVKATEKLVQSLADTGILEFSV